MQTDCRFASLVFVFLCVVVDARFPRIVVAVCRRAAPPAGFVLLLPPLLRLGATAVHTKWEQRCSRIFLVRYPGCVVGGNGGDSGDKVIKSRRTIKIARPAAKNEIANIDTNTVFLTSTTCHTNKQIRYRTLGSSLVMNILLNVVTPHIYWLVLWGLKTWKWEHNRAKAISQEDLNNLTKGLRWEVPYGNVVGLGKV